jgi:hypothetical protein
MHWKGRMDKITDDTTVQIYKTLGSCFFISSIMSGKTKEIIWSVCILY